MLTMFIYFFNILFISLVHLIIYHSTSPKKRFLQISLVYLFLVSSLRDRTIGADYNNYVNAFNIIKVTGNYYMEDGYVLLNRIVSFFTESYIGIAVAVNLLLFIPLYFYIKKYVDERFWGVCIFVFAANPYMFIQSTFNALRQGCATGFVIVGMLFLLKESTIKNVIIYCVTVLIAAQIHRMSYLMFIILLVLIIPWKKIYWLFVLGVTILGNIFGSQGIVRIIASRLRFGGYLGYKASELNHPIYILFITFVILYLLYRYEEIASLGKEKKKLIDLYIFSLCFLIMALPNDMFYRVYIMIAFCALPGFAVVCECVLSSKVRIKIKNENATLKLLYIGYYLSFYTGYILRLAARHNYMYVPFRFFFS